MVPRLLGAAALLLSSAGLRTYSYHNPPSQAAETLLAIQGGKAASLPWDLQRRISNPPNLIISMFARWLFILKENISGRYQLTFPSLILLRIHPGWVSPAHRAGLAARSPAPASAHARETHGSNHQRLTFQDISSLQFLHSRSLAQPSAEKH